VPIWFGSLSKIAHKGRAVSLSDNRSAMLTLQSKTYAPPSQTPRAARVLMATGSFGDPVAIWYGFPPFIASLAALDKDPSVNKCKITIVTNTFTTGYLPAYPIRLFSDDS
jgi:hypothetical protein